MTVTELPALGRPTKLKIPATAERRLRSGLTVIAVRRPAVPLVEIRLRIPFARAPLARASVLASALFTGTSQRSAVELAAALQAVGGGFGADHDPDWLTVSGNCLASGLDTTLELLHEVLADAAYPAHEVTTERERLADHIEIAETQPGHLARAALLRRRFGGHPYAVEVPGAAQVRAVGAGHLRGLHALRVTPRGAYLVVVGDIRPEQALDRVEAALGRWRGEAAGKAIPAIPGPPEAPLLLVDRPGAVQSSLRLALPAVGRSHPEHAAMQLANLVFGGYFSSRWVENIREDKGYTYSPFASVEHGAAGSMIVLSAEVATEVTAPAMLETMYELGRAASLPAEPHELEQARNYVLGALRIQMSTQAGLAGLVTAYAGLGLRIDHVATYSEALASATREQVAEAAARYLAPSRAVGIVLGEVARIEPGLAALLPVERAA
ncbi:peptidase M16 [Pilimelia terevasa]|uniref:Peptidase M16 n=1 Tax=Pilimelia terevasa TaxID=53372 RepID=A0A8J3BF68_9ACTN|nr:pitrilysin family protein [Pilimelia terevasa]GGK16984.1 peptidase M16 [Pilimelia terevasa]